MPYINKEARLELDTLMRDPDTAGELNYEITRMCRLYVLDKGTSYQTINDIIGALEGCKLEFYRRFAAPYEDRKIEENGDVY